MQLDNRLQAIVDLAEAGAPAADIGTDHAYLALALIRSGKSPHVIAGDKNEGPYLAACRTVKSAGMEHEIEVRLGDGLQPLLPGEASVLCIAGMGGQLITRILTDSPEVTAQARQLILQPMNAARELRRWLYASGWYLAEEALAEADGRIYQILSARKGAAPMPEDILLEIGPLLWEKKPPLLRRHIEERLARARRAVSGMKQSAHALGSPKYTEFTQRIKELEERLLW